MTRSDVGTATTGLVGRELVGFHVTSVLGEGGMAIVVRGENALDSSIVRALKIVRPELAARREFTTRFAEEARILERLQHQNVVRFYGVRKDQGLLVMELEFLEGTTLSKLLLTPRDGRTSAKAAVQWIRDASLGVAAAHDLGIVHRDLKPENLFLTRDDEIKVLDFGIARAIDEADRANKATVAGAVPGSPAYMAPEVCGGAVPTAAADVYALAMSLYELLLGYHPMLPPGEKRKSSTQLMMAQMKQVLPPLRAVRPDAPALLGEILARGLEKDPTKRIGSARSFATALDKVLAGMPAEATAAPLVVPPAAPSGVATRFELPTFAASAPDKSSAPPSPPPRPAPPPEPPPRARPTPAPVVAAAPVSSTTERTSTLPRRKAQRTLAIAVASGVLLVGVLGLVLAFRGSGGDRPASAVPKSTPPSDAAIAVTLPKPDAAPPQHDPTARDYKVGDATYLRTGTLSFTLAPLQAIKNDLVLVDDQQVSIDESMPASWRESRDWEPGDIVLFEPKKGAPIAAGVVEKVRIDGQLTATYFDGKALVTALFSPPQSMRQGHFPLEIAVRARDAWKASLTEAIRTAPERAKTEAAEAKEKARKAFLARCRAYKECLSDCGDFDDSACPE